MSKILNKWNKLHALQKIYVVLWFLFLVFLIVWVFVTAFGFPNLEAPKDPTSDLTKPVAPNADVVKYDKELYNHDVYVYTQDLFKYNEAVDAAKLKPEYATFEANNAVYKSAINLKANTIAALALVDTLILFGALILTVITNGFVLKGKKLFKNTYKKGGAF